VGGEVQEGLVLEIENGRFFGGAGDFEHNGLTGGFFEVEVLIAIAGQGAGDDRLAAEMLAGQLDGGSG
jgi:hypothetical protein